MRSDSGSGSPGAQKSQKIKHTPSTNLYFYRKIYRKNLRNCRLPFLDKRLNGGKVENEFEKIIKDYLSVFHTGKLKKVLTKPLEGSPI